MRKLFKERKLFKGGNYMRKYGSFIYVLFSVTCFLLRNKLVPNCRFYVHIKEFPPKQSMWRPIHIWPTLFRSIAFWQVEIKKKSNRPNQQIKPHPTTWPYPLMTYLTTYIVSFALLWHLIRVIGLMPIKRRGNFQMVKVVIRETLELLPWMFQSIYFSNKKNFFVSPILQMEVQSPKTCSKEGFCC